MLHVLLQIPSKNNHQKINNIVPCFVNHFNIVQCIFYSFDFLFSPRFDLNLIWSFFSLVRIISPSFILSGRLSHYQIHQILHQQWDPLYLQIKLSGLTFLSKRVISSSLSSASLLNISFCFEISGLSLSL